MSKAAVCAIGTILTILMSAVGVACIIIAATDGDNPCQGQDRSGLTLKHWLLGYGIADLILIFLAWMGVAVTMAELHMQEVVLPLGLFFNILWVLFKFCWFIVGVVVLARSNRDCVDQGTDIGVMVVVALSLQLFSCICSGGASGASK